MPRGPREQIAPNIFRDNLGLAAYANAAGRRREKRFPADTPLKVLRAWQDDARRELRRTAKLRASVAGTLEGDVERYLGALPDGRPKDNARWDLMPWVRALGPRPRRAITVHDLRLVVRDWLEQDKPPAASTLNHRRRALAQLWEALDGEDADCPARRLKRVTETLGPPSAYPMADLDAILCGMPRGRSRAILRLLLWTGLPPAGTMALDARRVTGELPDGVLTYPPRKKGAGAHGVTLPLYPLGIEAVQEWLDADAAGTWHHSTLRDELHRARLAYLRTLDTPARRRAYPVPATVRLYDLRHSFLTWLYRETGDPYLVQLYGQHADLATTARYTRGGVPERARQAIARHVAGARAAAENG